MVPSAARCYCNAATIPGSVSSRSLGNLADSFRLYEGRHHSRRSANRRAPDTTALLPQPLASVIDLVAVTAAAGGFALSALPLLTGQAKRDNADRPFDSDTEEEDFTFAVGAGVSFLPYANWTVRLNQLSLFDVLPGTLCYHYPWRSSEDVKGPL